MKTIKTEYKLVCHRSSTLFEREVAILTEEDWKPYGGLVAQDGVLLLMFSRQWLPSRQDKSAHRLKWVRERLREIEWCDNGHCPECKASSYERPRIHRARCWIRAEIDELEEENEEERACGTEEAEGEV